MTPFRVRKGTVNAALGTAKTYTPGRVRQNSESAGRRR